METNTNILTKVWGNSSLNNAWQRTSPELHIAFIIAVALGVHILVKIVRHISEWFIRQSHAKKNPIGFVTQQPKFVTLTRLIVSGVTFIMCARTLYGRFSLSPLARARGWKLAISARLFPGTTFITPLPAQNWRPAKISYAVPACLPAPIRHKNLT